MRRGSTEDLATSTERRAQLASVGALTLALATLISFGVQVGVEATVGIEHAPPGTTVSLGAVFIIIGLVAFALAIDPPKLLGIFAQKGVYGLAAARNEIRRARSASGPRRYDAGWMSKIRRPWRRPWRAAMAPTT